MVKLNAIEFFLLGLQAQDALSDDQFFLVKVISLCD